MKPSVFRSAVVFSLSLALAAIGYALHASGRSIAIQGPSGLIALNSGELLLGVDRQLWRLSAEGTLISAHELADIALPDPRKGG